MKKTFFLMFLSLSFILEAKTLEISSQTQLQKEIDSSQITLVDFYSTNCPPCKKLSPILEEFSTDRKDIKVLKVNADNSSNLLNIYEIKAFPTMLVFKNGKISNRKEGLFEIIYFLKNIDQEIK